MAEIRTVTTLRRKRDEIRRTIRDYEKKLDQAKADLAHLAAAIHIFEAKSGDTELPAYADIQRLFRYSESIKLSKEALADGPRSTREIATYIAKASPADGLPQCEAFGGHFNPICCIAA